jgi:hypothetical protein
VFIMAQAHGVPFENAKMSAAEMSKLTIAG